MSARSGTLHAQSWPVPSHVALIHYGESELRERLFDFLGPALDDPKQAIYLCGPPGAAPTLLGYLETSAGRNLRAEVTARRIVLGEGDPDADQQLQNLLDPVRELCDRGFDLVRVVGPADWDVPGYAAPEDFLWYESSIMPAIRDLQAVVLCQYDAARLPAAAFLYGALETHTHTVINGVLSKNDSYLPFDRYLAERLMHLPWLEAGDERRVVTPSSGGHPGRARRSRKR
jgi:hypothetical protein